VLQETTMKASAVNGYARAWIAVALAAALAGCIKIEDKNAPKGGDEASWVDHLNFGTGSISFDDGAVVLKRGSSTARIAADGDLIVDGAAVTIDDAQRRDLVAYRDAAHQLRTNALATGQAGVQLAKNVVSEVISGVASGDTSKIERNAELEAGKVKRAAARLCTDLGVMRAAQDRLAGTLTPFQPFATIDQAALDDCRRDTSPDAALAGATSAAPGTAAAPAGDADRAGTPPTPAGASPDAGTSGSADSPAATR
jgi:hypothetical protein